MGPSIDDLTHRLTECPEDFLMEAGPNGVRTSAVVFDTLAMLGRGVSNLRAFDTAAVAQQQIVLVMCWLITHPWFVEHPPNHIEEALRYLASELASVVGADLLVRDPDRREELSRLLLARFDVLPEGETREFAADRLRSISSVERKRLLEETRAQAEHAKRLREAMAEQRAKEAASRYTGE